MFSRKKPDVLVVGAGPVGLFTALALADRGVRVRIVDRAQRHATRSYALALHADSLRLLENAGLLTRILELSHRIRRLGLYDRERRRGEMRISDLPEDHSFVAVMPQYALEAVLEEALSERGVTVDWSHSVRDLVPRDDGVDVKIDRLKLDTLGYSVQHADWVVSKTREHDFQYVIGADGISSIVRQRLGIDFPAVGDRSEFAVFEFRTNVRLDDEARLILDEKTTNICWPLTHDVCRWSFQRPLDYPEHYSREKDVTYVQLGNEEFPELSDDYLRKLLVERAPWFQGSIEAIRWRMEVRFERRLAESFGRGRCWLVGDAGHVTGPAGIQSMNVGLREAVDLAEAVSATLMNGSDNELALYDMARRVEWRSLLGVAHPFSAVSQTDPWIAANIERLLPCVPASGRDLDRLLGQVGIMHTTSAATQVSG